MIQINDVFPTLQGEGANSGRAALFIRLPFCNLKCTWCDTEFNSFKAYTEEEILQKIRAYPVGFAVITGGEPSMNKHVHLIIEMLKNENFEIAMESNGTFAPPSGVDWLTVSPKQQNKINGEYFIHPEAFKKANEFKYVVDESFKWSILDRHDLRDGRKYYLSPEFNNLEDNTAKIISFIEKNPAWRLSLQTHKWLGIK